MAFVERLYLTAVDVPSGIPTGLPGQAIVEEAARKIGSADSIYAPLFILACGVIAFLSWLLWREGSHKSALLERVVVVAEGYKGALAALESMKTALTALNTAVHDLAREAEGEAKESRHGVANVMQVISHNGETIRRMENQLDRLANRGRSE